MIKPLSEEELNTLCSYYSSGNYSHDLEVFKAIPALLAQAREMNRFRELLDEASEYICAHGDLPKHGKWGGTRYWCLLCQSYVRTEEEFTLKARVMAALETEMGK